MKTQVGIAAVICAGVMMFAYLADLYPGYVVVGCIGIMAYLAFRDNSPVLKKKDSQLLLPPEDPTYVD
jgi:hypothetical protein